MGRRKRDADTEFHLGRIGLNKAARASKREGAGVPGQEHSGDHRYYFKNRREGWVLKPEYKL